MRSIITNRSVLSFVLLFLFEPGSVSGQPVIFQDPVTAKNFDSEKYSEVKGSPFLFEKWTTGSVTTPRGIYKNLSLKLDAYESTLLFQKDDQPREFMDPVTSFILMPDVSDSSRNMLFRNGLTGPSLRTNQYVQVLGEGTISLYRSDIKLLSEVNEINKGVVKTFNNSTRYYILKDGNLKLIRLNKKELMNAFGDKQDKMEQYINENNLSSNKDADLKLIIHYYNSL